MNWVSCLAVVLVINTGCDRSPKVAPATTPDPATSSQTTPVAATGTISGGFWINRSGGESQVQRGAVVVLLRSRVSRASIDDDLREAVAERKSWSITDWTKASREVEALIPKLPGEMRVDEARTIVAKNSRDGIPSITHIAIGSAVANTKTGIDGTYSFPAVPNGDYFAWSLVANDAFYAEWLVPVHIEGRSVVLNFDNSNAISIRNLR